MKKRMPLAFNMLGFTVVVLIICGLAHAAIVGMPISFIADVEESEKDYARLGLKARGGDPTKLDAYMAMLAKVNVEHEYKILVSIGRSKRLQDKAVAVEAVLQDGLADAVK